MSGKKLSFRKPTEQEKEEDPRLLVVASLVPKKPKHAIEIRLDVLLAERKMTLTELSEKVGIHVNNLSKLKNGDVAFIRLETLDKICEALDCTPGELLTRLPG